MVQFQKHFHPYSLGREGLLAVADFLAGRGLAHAMEGIARASELDADENDMNEYYLEHARNAVATGGWSTLQGGLTSLSVGGVATTWEIPSLLTAEASLAKNFADLIIADASYSSTLVFERWRIVVSETLGSVTVVLSEDPMATWTTWPPKDIATRNRDDAGRALLDELSATIAPFQLEVGQDSMPFRVFIGHGGDEQWKVLKRVLEDSHGFEVEAFESEERAGYTTLETVNLMVRSSAAGVVVMTAADTMADGSSRARENVVHEIGFCQGALGIPNTIVVMENGVTEFTNIAGLTQIRFDRTNILAAEGAVVEALSLRRNARVEANARGLAGP